MLSAGASRAVSTWLGAATAIVDGSARGYVALTGSYLTQTIEGLEKLLQMPFGCGEQNMILFAPNVFVARYLKETEPDEAGDHGQGRDDDDHRLPARADLPAQRRQLLRLRQAGQGRAASG